MLTCRQGLYYEYVIAIFSIADSIRNDISISIFSSTCASDHLNSRSIGAKDNISDFECFNKYRKDNK